MHLRHLGAITLAGLLGVAGWNALGQTIGGGSGVTQAYVDTAISNLNASLTAAMPTPSMSVPLGPLLLGAGASNNQFVPSAATQRQGVMRTTILTDSSGNWTVTWANGFTFISSIPTVVTQAGNPAGANTIICNWRTRSATGASGFCQQVNTSLIALLGITITVAPTIPATNTPISVVMAEPTQ